MASKFYSLISQSSTKVDRANLYDLVLVALPKSLKLFEDTRTSNFSDEEQSSHAHVSALHAGFLHWSHHDVHNEV